jgi:hypothetical protein
MAWRALLLVWLVQITAVRSAVAGVMSGSASLQMPLQRVRSGTPLQSIVSCTSRCSRCMQPWDA